MIASVSVSTLIFLVALGARLGGGKIILPALRVGPAAMAMAVTAGIGALVGKAEWSGTSVSDVGGGRLQVHGAAER